MKVTKPRRETVSSLNYRDAEETPTATAPDIKALAGAALGLLARAAAAPGEGDNPGDKTWSVTTAYADGMKLEIRCTGPDLPGEVPDRTVHPSIVPFERPWVGTYRLTVSAPLIVLDLYWRPKEPLRIMGFSRGDWEVELAAIAQ